MKHDGLQEDENSVFSIILLGAIMTDCIISTESTFLDASSYIKVKTVQFKQGVDLNSKTLPSRKEDPIPQGSAKCPKELFLSAAVNFL